MLMLKQEQQKLQQEFKDIQKELKDIEQKNKELEDPRDLGDTKKEEDKANDELIKIIEETIFEEINIDFSKKSCEAVIDTYKTFYQKVTYRNKDLSRVNIFTTNNDLFNERVLDNLNINYNNGFGGGLERFFNPARFGYTFSKKIETSIEKYEALEDEARMRWTDPQAEYGIGMGVRYRFTKSVGIFTDYSYGKFYNNDRHKIKLGLAFTF
jgi:hypothetical protein